MSSADPIAGLREVVTLLRSFDGPLGIYRAAELAVAADRVVFCAAQLTDRTEPEDLQQRLASVVKAIRAAERAGRAHGRYAPARPFARTRFALKVGWAGGRLQGTLEELAAGNRPPSA